MKFTEALVAVSLANVLFLPAWRRLIYPSDPSYNIKYLPDTLEYFTIILSVAFMGAAFYFALAATRKLGPKAVVFAKVVFLGLVSFAFLTLGIMVLKTQFWVVPLIGRKVLTVSGLLVGLSTIAFCVWRYNHMVRYARAAMLILAPLVLITFSQAIILAFTLHGETANGDMREDPRPLPILENAPKSRVVWVIFDELDYRLAFESRPEGIDLPEFDRLKAESIHATNAIAPSRSTLTSIPSLMTGRHAIEADPTGPSELLLTFADSQKAERFSEQPTIFSEVRNRGLRTGVVGWYHPYCRVLPSHFDVCHWETFDELRDFPTDTVPSIIVGNFIRVINELPHELRDKITRNGEYVRRHNEMMAQALQLVEDPTLDLVFIHLTVPHYPSVYDRHTDRFTGGGGYPDNLVLADKMLSDLREHMEKSGTWETSAVLVSSDHQFRIRDNISTRDRRLIGKAEDPRVPFLLKLPYSSQSIEITEELTTLVTHDLIERLIYGSSDAPQETADWLRHGHPRDRTYLLNSSKLGSGGPVWCRSRRLRGRRSTISNLIERQKG